MSSNLLPTTMAHTKTVPAGMTFDEVPVKDSSQNQTLDANPVIATESNFDLASVDKENDTSDKEPKSKHIDNPEAATENQTHKVEVDNDDLLSKGMVLRSEKKQVKGPTHASNKGPAETTTSDNSENQLPDKNSVTEPESNPAHDKIIGNAENTDVILGPTLVQLGQNSAVV